MRLYLLTAICCILMIASAVAIGYNCQILSFLFMSIGMVAFQYVICWDQMKWNKIELKKMKAEYDKTYEILIKLSGERSEECDRLNKFYRKQVTVVGLLCARLCEIDKMPESHYSYDFLRDETFSALRQCVKEIETNRLAEQAKDKTNANAR